METPGNAPKTPLDPLSLLHESARRIIEYELAGLNEEQIARLETLRLAEDDVDRDCARESIYVPALEGFTIFRGLRPEQMESVRQVVREIAEDREAVKRRFEALLPPPPEHPQA